MGKENLSFADVSTDLDAGDIMRRSRTSACGNDETVYTSHKAQEELERRTEEEYYQTLFEPERRQGRNRLELQPVRLEVHPTDYSQDALEWLCAQCGEALPKE